MASSVFGLIFREWTISVESSSCSRVLLRTAMSAPFEAFSSRKCNCITDSGAQERTRFPWSHKMMSAHTVGTLDPATIEAYTVWLRAFDRRKRERYVSKEFEGFIKAGCNRDDLNWALFSVPFNFDKKCKLPKKIKRFFRAVDAILPRIDKLRKQLDILIELPLENSTALATFVAAWGQILPSLNIPRQLKQIRHTSKTLSDLYVWLDAIRAIRIDNPTSSALATSAYEILLFEYVTRATTETISREQISLQMEVACEAYGIEGRSYSVLAATRRYGRFRRDFPKEFKEIGLSTPRHKAFNTPLVLGG